jgi:S-DNA-T family DNA segregation ATPase FtsK/SpoIIIE
MAATVAQGARQERLAQWRAGMRRGAQRTGALTLGGGLIATAAFALASLASYRTTDPSLNTAAAGPVDNWLGTPGAWTADLLLSLWGLPCALLLPLLFLIGLRVARGTGAGRWGKALLLMALGMALLGAGAALLSGGAVNGLPAGWGGAFGLSIARLVELALGAIGEPGVVAPFRFAAVAVATIGGLAACWFGLGLRAEERGWIASRRLPRLERNAAAADDADDDDYLPEPEERPARPTIVPAAEPSRTVIADRAKAPEKRRPARDRQPSLALGDEYQLPSIDLLSPAPPPVGGPLDKPVSSATPASSSRCSTTSP